MKIFFLFLTAFVLTFLLGDLSDGVAFPIYQALLDPATLGIITGGQILGNLTGSIGRGKRQRRMNTGVRNAANDFFGRLSQHTNPYTNQAQSVNDAFGGYNQQLGSIQNSLSSLMGGTSTGSGGFGYGGGIASTSGPTAGFTPDRGTINLDALANAQSVVGVTQNPYMDFGTPTNAPNDPNALNIQNLDSSYQNIYGGLADMQGEYGQIGKSLGKINKGYKGLLKEYDGSKKRLGKTQKQVKGQTKKIDALQDTSIIDTAQGQAQINQARDLAEEQRGSLQNIANLNRMSDEAILAGFGNITQGQGNTLRNLAGQETFRQRGLRNELTNLYGLAANLEGQQANLTSAKGNVFQARRGIKLDQANMLGREQGLLNNLANINRNRQGLIDQQSGLLALQADLTNQQARNSQGQFNNLMNLAGFNANNYGNAWGIGNTMYGNATAQQQAQQQGLSNAFGQAGSLYALSQIYNQGQGGQGGSGNNSNMIGSPYWTERIMNERLAGAGV